MGWHEVADNPDALISYDILVERSTEQRSDPVYSQPFTRSYYNQFTKRWNIPCRVEMPDDSLKLSPAYSIAFYRVVQEALTNITKYAHAKNVSVSLLRSGEQWTLRIADDGVGIDTAKPHNTTAHGLVSMRERARALGGEFSVRGQPGRGTVVEVTAPLEKEKVT